MPCNCKPCEIRHIHSSGFVFDHLREPSAPAKGPLCKTCEFRLGGACKEGTDEIWHNQKCTAFCAAGDLSRSKSIGGKPSRKIVVDRVECWALLMGGTEGLSVFQLWPIFAGYIPGYIFQSPFWRLVGGGNGVPPTMLESFHGCEIIRTPSRAGQNTPNPNMKGP